MGAWNAQAGRSVGGVEASQAGEQHEQWGTPELQQWMRAVQQPGGEDEPWRNEEERWSTPQSRANPLRQEGEGEGEEEGEGGREVEEDGVTEQGGVESQGRSRGLLARSAADKQSGAAGHGSVRSSAPEEEASCRPMGLFREERGKEGREIDATGDRQKARCGTSREHSGSVPGSGHASSSRKGSGSGSGKSSGPEGGSGFERCSGSAGNRTVTTSNSNNQDDTNNSNAPDTSRRQLQQQPQQEERNGKSNASRSGSGSNSSGAKLVVYGAPPKGKSRVLAVAGLDFLKSFLPGSPVGVACVGAAGLAGAGLWLCLAARSRRRGMRRQRGKPGGKWGGRRDIGARGTERGAATGASAGGAALASGSATSAAAGDAPAGLFRVPSGSLSVKAGGGRMEGERGAAAAQVTAPAERQARRAGPQGECGNHTTTGTNGSATNYRGMQSLVDRVGQMVEGGRDGMVAGAAGVVEQKWRDIVALVGQQQQQQLKGREDKSRSSVTAAQPLVDAQRPEQKERNINTGSAKSLSSTSSDGGTNGGSSSSKSTGRSLWTLSGSSSLSSNVSDGGSSGDGDLGRHASDAAVDDDHLFTACPREAVSQAGHMRAHSEAKGSTRSGTGPPVKRQDVKGMERMSDEAQERGKHTGKTRGGQWELFSGLKLPAPPAMEKMLQEGPQKFLSELQKVVTEGGHVGPLSARGKGKVEKEGSGGSIMGVGIKHHVVQKNSTTSATLPSADLPPTESSKQDNGLSSSSHMHREGDLEGMGASTKIRASMKSNVRAHSGGVGIGSLEFGARREEVMGDTQRYYTRVGEETSVPFGAVVKRVDQLKSVVDQLDSLLKQSGRNS